MADRSVEELLKLSSYQGMTDSEIEALTEYKCKLAADAASYEAKKANLDKTIKRMQDVSKKSCELNEKLFKEAIEQTPIFRTVQDG